MADKRGRVKRDEVKKDGFEVPGTEFVDYVYSTGKDKNKVELKVFNPELHNENQILKKKYEL